MSDCKKENSNIFTTYRFPIFLFTFFVKCIKRVSDSCECRLSQFRDIQQNQRSSFRTMLNTEYEIEKLQDKISRMKSVTSRKKNWCLRLAVMPLQHKLKLGWPYTMNNFIERSSWSQLYIRCNDLFLHIFYTP